MYKQISNFTEIENKTSNLGVVIKATKLKDFVSFQIKRAIKGEISYMTIRNYYRPTKLFCEMNEIELSWKKISRGIPKGREYADDRIPTLEEIRKIMEYPDRRIKPIIYTMVSSGIRIGAFDHLQWKHVIPIYDENRNILAAKIIENHVKFDSQTTNP
jgi:integrase